MKLNCKKGDLAFYVGAVEKSLGRVVMCKRFKPDGWGYPAWFVDPPISVLVAESVVLLDYVRDEVLRPIRGGDIPQSEITSLYGPKERESEKEIQHG